MRHVGEQYLIVRNINLLNHRGENGWIHVLERAACVYAHFPNFRPEVAPYDVSRFLLCGFYARNVACYLRAAISVPG